MGCLQGRDRLPTFVIASPPDMHLAPLAVLHGNHRIAHVIVGNGLGARDIEWIKAQAPTVPVVQLTASLDGNAKTYLPHAEVVRLCQKASRGDFAIQDADCFVTETAWWNDFRISSKSEFAAGPFYKPLQKIGHSVPDTYLVAINAVGYQRRESQGIQPNIYNDTHPVARQLQARGITGPYLPEEGKGYVDTMQMHWLAATLDGEEFRPLPGADSSVFHVGGSTYLTTKTITDVSHWDYWPLNTCYFHMRVLELPRFASIKSRYGYLFQNYGSPENVIQKYPEFKKSKRYSASETILDCFSDYLLSSSS
jgi:hypothetical protein